ncbi:MAG: DNA primase [candidate division WOR-3 bacterium]
MKIIMKKISEDFFERIDIIELVSEVVQLKKVGNQYRGLCPFHNEKTPSFYVSPIGVYHCFGCGESGNAIKFVMRIYGFDYQEAIEYIARKFNIKLEEFEEEDSYLYKVLEYACDFYVNNLKKDERALNYLLSRNLNINSIVKFKIGYADSSNNIIKFLIDKGFGLDVIFRLGLAYRDFKGDIKPFFTNRIMFPIFSTNGSYLIGFSGRSLDSSEPKYKNSQDSKIFKKSQILYGFNFAKSSIVKNKYAIVVEGFFDVIALHQRGYNNAVSVMGTNISEYQAKMLKKYVDKIYIFFDNDESGYKAIIKSLSNILNASLIPYIILPNERKDPDEIVFEGGLDNYLKNPYNINDYFKFLYDKTSKMEEKINLIESFKEALSNVKVEGGRIIISELKPVIDNLDKVLKLKIILKNISEIQFNDEVYALWSVYKSKNMKAFLDSLDEDVFNSKMAKELFRAIKMGILSSEDNLKLISKIEFSNKELSESSINEFIKKWQERKIIKKAKIDSDLRSLEELIKLKRRF